MFIQYLRIFFERMALIGSVYITNVGYYSKIVFVTSKRFILRTPRTWILLVLSIRVINSTEKDRSKEWGFVGSILRELAFFESICDHHKRPSPTHQDSWNTCCGRSVEIIKRLISFPDPDEEWPRNDFHASFDQIRSIVAKKIVLFLVRQCSN